MNPATPHDSVPDLCDEDFSIGPPSSPKRSALLDPDSIYDHFFPHPLACDWALCYLPATRFYFRHDSIEAAHFARAMRHPFISRCAHHSADPDIYGEITEADFLVRRVLGS